MARGKYAHRAAQKRAEAAEMTADRYIEQSQHWKRIANQNKGMAELTLGLQAEVKRLRTALGVPKEEHDAALLAEQERVNAWAAVFHDILQDIGTALTPYVREGLKLFSVELMQNLRQLPGDMGSDFLAADRAMQLLSMAPGETKFGQLHKNFDYESHGGTRVPLNDDSDLVLSLKIPFAPDASEGTAN